MTIKNGIDGIASSSTGGAGKAVNVRTSVLSDHKRVRSKLVTPFNDMFGGTKDVSWINTMIPELLWIAFLHDTYGDARAVEIVTAFTRDVRALSVTASQSIWAAAGRYTDLPGTSLSDIGTTATYAHDLRAALAPLASWYPAHPLNGIYAGDIPEPTQAGLLHLKQLVASMFDRSARGPMMVQATATWLAFDSGILKVAQGLALAQFPKIEEYPSTEISIRVGASIRSTLNMFFGDDEPMASNGTWAPAFWNRGIELEPCE
ncbi:hypothetical protein ACH37Y_04570 [Sphingomonas paucimobilis]|uniref:hypothetical protein n=1 Tax=Sphingomonas paucimobilis TaxID=13689 RepID=UPI0037A3EA92